MTGRDLVERMLARVRAFPDDCDAYVLLDDADCRFCGQPAALAEWTADVGARLRAAVGRDIRFIALIAAQEIESWLVADWNETFGREYRALAHELRRALDRELGRDIEAFGCPAQDGGGCSVKPSVRIAELLSTLPANELVRRRYSKRIEGAAMLRRAAPHRIADACGSCFRPAYHELLRLTSDG